jgi:putative transposase
VPARQTAAGTIVVEVPAAGGGAPGVVVDARVSSDDQGVRPGSAGGPGDRMGYRSGPDGGRGGARGLNRAIADAAPAELRRQLAYKSTWHGSRLVVADRRYPSSKTCSACGVVKATLALAERDWTCDGCGARHDRDVNAAINLARLSEHAPGVEGRPAGSGPAAGRRAIRNTSPPSGALAGGKEASTPHSSPPAADQTGTAPPQGEAA